MLKRAIAIIPLIFLVSCGSITRGTEEAVTITSDPADARISTSIGNSCPQSPCTFKVKRKAEFTAYAEKPGYEKGSIDIKTKVSGKGAAGMAGNVIVGGVIGVGIDSATGAALDHYPNPAHIKLQPVAKPAAAPAKGKGKGAKRGAPTS